MNNFDYTVRIVTNDSVMNYQFENASTERVSQFVKLHMDKCHSVIIQKVDRQRQHALGEISKK